MWRERIVSIIALGLAWGVSAVVMAQTVSIEPLFRSSQRLSNPYGICSHLGDDFEVGYRKADLSACSRLGVGNVRADIRSEIFYRRDNPYGGVKRDLAGSGVTFLPILSRTVGWKFGWERRDEYMRYVRESMTMFGDAPVWEYMNEIDLAHGNGVGVESVYDGYVRLLPEVAKEVHSRGKKLTTSGAAEAVGFVEEIRKRGDYMKYFDIFNFHTYTNLYTPESRYEYYGKIAKALKESSFDKEVWLTETGYHTEAASKRFGQFFHNVLPQALTNLGIARRAEVAIVCDHGYKQYGATEQTAGIISSLGYREKYISLSEIAELDVKETPVLLPSVDEGFPYDYLDALVGYVKRGGTVVFSFGIPLYYDRQRGGILEMKGAGTIGRLHAEAVLQWGADFKKTGLPDTPTEYRRAKGYENTKIDWQSGWTNMTRYMGEGGLRGRDRLIPIVTGGDKRRQAAVCGIYKLDSDMKGNVVFYTNMDYTLEVTEELQARRLPRTYILAFASGISKVFWYNLRAFEEKVEDPEHHYGIVHKDMTEKPAYRAYRHLTEMLTDGSERPTLEMETETGVYHARWRRADGKTVDAYWTTFGTATVSLGRKLARRVESVSDHAGRERKLRGEDVEVSNSVTYIVSR